MKKQDKRACPYCGAINWIGGHIDESSDSLWIASAFTGQWPIVELMDIDCNGSILLVDECQTCGTVVSL